MSVPDADDAGQIVAVVFNPTKVDERTFKARVREMARHGDWHGPLWLPTTVEDPGTGQARAAVARGASLVLAAGGDGTVRAVAEGLRGSGVALAVVPLGTGNLLARNLQIPLANLVRALEIAFTGTDRVIDMGLATLQREDGTTLEQPFLVAGGLGLDAAMFAATSPGLKSRLGWLAYVDAGVRTLPRLKDVRITVRIEDSPERTAQVANILIANCGLLPGNINLIPDARIDDGELDIAILQPRSFFQWLLIWRRVTWENRVLRRSAFGRRIIRFSERGPRTELIYRKGAEVYVTVEHPEPFEIDGEELGDIVGVRMRVVPAALTVRVAA